MTTPNPTTPARWPAQLMVLAAAGGAVLTVAHPSATRQFTWPWVLLLAGLWLAPLASTLGALAGRGSWTRPNTLLSAGLALLAAATLVSAALSPFASLSLLRVWPTLAGVALFFWLHHWLADPAGTARAGRVARGLAMFGAGLAWISLGGWAAVASGGSGLTRNDVPFGHSTYTAGALLLILPWLVRATVKGRGLPRAGWALSVAAALGALLATSSRSGAAAVAMVAAIAAGLVVLRAAWSRRAKTLLVIGAAAVLLVAVLANPRLRELVQHGGWGDSSRESNAQRNAMLEAGVRLGAMRPLTGWGPGTVPLMYPKVRALLSGGVDNVLQLHNSPAQLWATLGGGGILALALLLAATGRRLGQLLRQPAPLAVTAAASVAGYGLFALTDHQLDLPAMNALLVLNLALLFQGASRPELLSPGSRRLAGMAGLVILVPLLLPLGRDLFARSSYEQSLTLFEHGREADGLDCLNTAADWAPYDPYYRHQLAERLLEKRAKTSDPAAQAQLTAAATAQLEQSLAAGCLEEFAHFNLGWLALEAGQPARAASHFLATLREAPHRGGAYFGLGLALRGAGNQTAAVRAFALEWVNDPATFTAPVWEWPDFAPLRPLVAREADHLLAGLAPTQPQAGYVRELWNWWAGGGVQPGRGFNRGTDLFVMTLRTGAAGQPPPPGLAGYDWGLLFDAWRQLPDPAALSAVAGPDASFATALARRAARHPAPDWHGFLTAGLENEPALLQNLRPARTGYGVLALHPDGPVLTDLYIIQENRLVSTFASALFPAKGWVPARELLDRLPAATDPP